MAKYKFYGMDDEGDTKLIHTENHGKDNASMDDFRDSLNAISVLKGVSPDYVVQTSETTVYQAE